MITFKSLHQLLSTAVDSRGSIVKNSESITKFSTAYKVIEGRHPS